MHLLLSIFGWKGGLQTWQNLDIEFSQAKQSSTWHKEHPPARLSPNPGGQTQDLASDDVMKGN